MSQATKEVSPAVAPACGLERESRPAQHREGTCRRRSRYGWTEMQLWWPKESNPCPPGAGERGTWKEMRESLLCSRPRWGLKQTYAPMS